LLRLKLFQVSSNVNATDFAINGVSLKSTQSIHYVEVAGLCAQVQ